jgi:hypothetical protein
MDYRCVIEWNVEEQMYTVSVFYRDKDGEWERQGRPCQWSYVEAVLEHARKTMLPYHPESLCKELR